MCHPRMWSPEPDCPPPSMQMCIALMQDYKPHYRNVSACNGTSCTALLMTANRLTGCNAISCGTIPLSGCCHSAACMQGSAWGQHVTMSNRILANYLLASCHAYNIHERRRHKRSTVSHAQGMRNVCTMVIKHAALLSLVSEQYQIARAGSPCPCDQG